MATFFRITGNFTYGEGEWQTPDPSFIGEIEVQEDGFFVGYCKELYGAYGVDVDIFGNASAPQVMDGLEGYEDRLLAGYLYEAEPQGITYIKFAENPHLSPILYIITDLTRGGWWGGLRSLISNAFIKMGEARTEILPLATSQDDETHARICAKFGVSVDTEADISHLFPEDKGFFAECRDRLLADR